MHAISRRTNKANLRKWQKNLDLGLILALCSKFGLPNFIFKNLAASVTRCHAKVSSCTISGKTNDPILRKLSDRWIDGQTEGQTDKSDFIGRCSTNAKRPKENCIDANQLENMIYLEKNNINVN